MSYCPSIRKTLESDQIILPTLYFGWAPKSHLLIAQVVFLHYDGRVSSIAQAITTLDTADDPSLLVPPSESETCETDGLVPYCLLVLDTGTTLKSHVRIAHSIFRMRAKLKASSHLLPPLYLVRLRKDVGVSLSLSVSDMHPHEDTAQCRNRLGPPSIRPTILASALELQ